MQWQQRYFWFHLGCVEPRPAGYQKKKMFCSIATGWVGRSDLEMDCVSRVSSDFYSLEFEGNIKQRASFSINKTSGCQRSIIRTVLSPLTPPWLASWMKESSNSKSFFSVQCLFSPFTHKKQPSGANKGKWHLILQFVGPKWGVIWVPGLRVENKAFPNEQSLMNDPIDSIIFTVFGQLAQFFATFSPWLNRWKTNHSPSGVVFLNHPLLRFSLICLNSDFIDS